VNEPVVAIVGLGYVGYPLAVAFGQHVETIGFDINETRIGQLKRQFDQTNEIDIELVKSAVKLTLTSDSEAIRKANIYIVTTATPVNAAQQPDLAAVLNAATTIGSVITTDDIVILESTVSPGVTEGGFALAIEQESRLTAGIDFQLGYSPERINPGDELHRLQHIVKVVSATNNSTLNTIYQLYKRIIPAGVVKAASIQTAEFSKLIENTQRDINIAFMNEMYQLSDKLGLNFNQVLECAGSKWNFLDFKPGLVGGHCVAVDPYYLVHSQILNGLTSRMTTAARQTNEDMVDYVASSFIKKLTKAGLSLPSAKVLIIGISFKPNCPDVRNSKHLAVIQELVDFGLKPDVYDPIACLSNKDMPYRLHSELPDSCFDAILLLVPHDEVIQKLETISTTLMRTDSIFYSLDSKYSDLVK